MALLGPSNTSWPDLVPKKAPKMIPQVIQQKRDPKMDPKIIIFWTNFGTILGAILGPELAQKLDQKWDHFWTPRRRISGVGELRFCELNRSGGIAMATGIIFDKRKGGICIHIWALHTQGKNNSGHARTRRNRFPRNQTANLIV